jgi:tetratricopeptide (TPR) repeat protein
MVLQEFLILLIKIIYKIIMSNIENEIKILLNLFNSAKFDILISKAKKLIKKAPEYLILYNILGSAYQNIGDLKLAKETFLKGYKMEPNNIAIMNNLANVYKNIGEIEQSESLFKKIIEKKPDYINAYVNYGNLKRDNNDFEFAIDLYNKALKINSQIPAVLYSLALAYQGLGKFDLAIDYAKKTLEIEPKFTQADMLISQSKKYQAGDLHYEEMNLKINSLILNDEQKTNLFFALAKAEEDMGLIEKSFNNLDIANSIRRKSLNFNINNETNFFNQLKNIFTKIDLSQKFTEQH